ncbi:methyl-accepting chemotaxis protein [Natrarchaeobius sp. A-rgal3]|uniref:methyl-accepting chemotaxis protein n=1 Tax=Natrarchaeobius versutus TaxID=1679078 RepID=UPI00350F6CF0
MSDNSQTTDDSNQSAGTSGGRSVGSLLVPGVIRRRLIAKTLVAIFAILLLTAAISTFFYFGISDELDGQVDNQVEQTTELHTNVVERWMNEREHELQDIERSQELNSEDPDRVSNFLTGEAYGSGFSDVHMIDEETGEVIGSSSESAVGENMYDLIDEELAQQRTFVTPERYTNVDDEEVIAMGHRRSLLTGHVVIGEIPAEHAGPDLPQAIEGADTAVVNEDGGVVIGTDSVDPSVVDSDVEGIGKSEDSQSIYTYSSVDGEDLYVVTTTPQETAFAVRDEVQLSFVVTIVLTGLVFVAVGLVGGRSVSKELNQLRDRAQTMEEGNLSVDLQTGRVDEIGSLYRSFDSMRNSLRDQIHNAQTARQEAETERERVQRLNDQLEDAAQEYCTVMGAAADGDLAVRADVDTDNEAMQTVGEDFNEMLDDIEATIADLQTFATEVAIASEQVTASSEEVRSASEQISESVQEISTGSERQNRSLQEATGEMSNLSTTTEQIAASSNEVADLAARTANTGQAGHEAAQDAIESMTDTETEAERAVEEIRALEAEVGQIDELIERIQQIAEQTNMLALNANIEASRSASGDDGEGFGVVAQEIKELSGDAKSAAAEIEARLESIREQTVTSAEEVEETSERLESASDQVEEAVDALEEIAEYAAETNTGVQEISAATEEQAATTQEVVAIVDEAATISEETTAEAESVAAAAEEQTTAMTEVSGSASQLSQQATQLSEALDHFETDIGDDTGGIATLEIDEDDPSEGDDDDVSDDEADTSSEQPDVDASEPDQSVVEEPPVASPDDPTATPGAEDRPGDSEPTLSEDGSTESDVSDDGSDGSARTDTDDAADVFQFEESDSSEDT